MVVCTYDGGSAASDQKHGFLKFWTLELENGVKWSSGTSLDDCPKKIPAFFLCFLRYSMKFWGTPIQNLRNSDQKSPKMDENSRIVMNQLLPESKNGQNLRKVCTMSNLSVKTESSSAETVKFKLKMPKLILNRQSYQMNFQIIQKTQKIQFKMR